MLKHVLHSVKMQICSLLGRSTRVYVGSVDEFGNRYYETELYGKTRRMIEPLSEKELGLQSYDTRTIPAEWDSWLRRRRHDPPTADELAASKSYRELVQRRAAELDLKRTQAIQRQEDDLRQLKARNSNESHLKEKPE